MYSCFNARALGLKLSGRDTIELAAQCGFDGVDLMVRDLVEAGEPLQELNERMTDLALLPGAFPLPINWRGDRQVYERELAELPKLAEVAQRLGLIRTGTWVMPQVPNAFGTDIQGVVDLHHERLGAIARVLDAHGIRLGLEVIGVSSSRTGQGPRFITRLDELTPVLGPINSIGPNVGVLVDAFHLYAADEPWASALEWGIDQVVWVHVADLPRGADGNRSRIIDAIRGLPGENGAVDISGFLKVLFEAGYKGPVTVEPLARCESLMGLNPFETTRAASSALRRVWPPEETSR